MTRPSTTPSSASANSKTPDHLSQGPAGQPGRALTFAGPRWTQGNWHLLADPAARFTHLGPGWHERKTDTGRRTRSLLNQLRALHPEADITITPAAA